MFCRPVINPWVLGSSPWVMSGSLALGSPGWRHFASSPDAVRLVWCGGSGGSKWFFQSISSCHDLAWFGLVWLITIRSWSMHSFVPSLVCLSVCISVLPVLSHPILSHPVLSSPVLSHSQQSKRLGPGTRQRLRTGLFTPPKYYLFSVLHS